jgi:hypothetical protein
MSGFSKDSLTRSLSLAFERLAITGIGQRSNCDGRWTVERSLAGLSAGDRHSMNAEPVGQGGLRQPERLANEPHFLSGEHVAIRQNVEKELLVERVEQGAVQDDALALRADESRERLAPSPSAFR